jgi:hypothetical protein
MKKLNLIGSAIVAPLVVTPIFAASTASAQSRKKNVGATSGHCKNRSKMKNQSDTEYIGGNF